MCERVHCKQEGDGQEKCVCSLHKSMPVFVLSPFLSHFLSLQRGLMRLGCWIPEQLIATHIHTHAHTLLPASIYSAPSAAATSRHRLSINTHLVRPIFHSVCAHVELLFHLAAFILFDLSILWSSTNSPFLFADYLSDLQGRSEGDPGIYWEFYGSSVCG